MNNKYNGYGKFYFLLVQGMSVDTDKFQIHVSETIINKETYIKLKKEKFINNSWLAQELIETSDIVEGQRIKKNKKKTSKHGLVLSSKLPEPELMVYTETYMFTKLN